MPWKHIVAPTRGLVTNKPSTALEDQASPYMSGVILKDGLVKSDFGMTAFPAPSTTQSNDLDGTLMKIEQFRLLDGTTYLIALTTTHLYSYNTATNTWDVYTRGSLLDNCEDAWTGGTGIVNSADGVVKLRGTYSSKNVILEGVPDIHFPMDDDAADTDVEDTGGDFTGTLSQNTEDITAGGVIDAAFNFESTGDEDYIDNDNAGLQAGILDDTLGSIAMWVRTESMAADMVICSWGDTNANGRLILKILTTGEVSAELHDGTATQWHVQTAAGVIEAGTWYHIVLRQTGTTIEIHLDTENEGLIYNVSTDLTMWLNDITGIDNARIGCHNYNSGGNAEFFDGLMDDFRYYSTSIPDSDIDGLHNDGNGTGEVGGFTTGIISYEGVATADISAAINTHLSFWIYSDIAIAAEVLSMRISEQAAGGVGATYADYYIPAIVASTWQHISIAIATPDADNGGDYPDDFNAVSTIALIANSDPGACIIYIDDVRTCQCFTGDEDNRWSVATLNDTMMITNGVDAPTKLEISGGLTHSAATLSLPTGSLTTCEVVLAFKDHMLYFNNTENGGDAPQRCSWSNIGDIEDHVAGTSGFQDLLDDDGWVMGAELLSENEVAVYKERSVVQCTWVGGHTPFRFRTILNDTGIVNKDCVSILGAAHAVFDTNITYLYKGDSAIKPIDDNVKRTMYGRVDGAYTERIFMMYVKEDDELQLWLPVAATTPDEGYTLDLKTGAWYLKDRNISGFGFYQAQSSLTIGDLVGTIGEQDWTFGSQLIKEFFPITLVGDSDGKVYSLDNSTLDNDSTAIVNEFQTPDFVLPGEPQYMNENMRVALLIFEASGQSVTVTYSTDGGASWSPTQGGGTNIVTLDSIFKDYEQHFETDAKRIRFKFYNETAASGFQLRHYGFYWLKRTGRR